MNKITIGIIIVSVLIIAIITGFLLSYHNPNTPACTPPNCQNTAFEIDNPASTNCINQGGVLSIKTLKDGGQYGVCTFPDGSQCEEWKLMRNECSKGQYLIGPKKVCPTKYVPVCGVNGVTYSSGCMAGNVPVLRNGEC